MEPVKNSVRTAKVSRNGLLASLQDLSVRLDVLESVQAIADLHRGFVRAVADRRFEGLADYFTDDAVIDMRSHGPQSGRAIITRHFEGMAKVPLAGAGYMLTSPVIEVNGDTARGVWTWHRFHSRADIAGRPTRIFGAWEEGRYDCDYRRTNGEWLFSRMHFRVVRPDPDPEPDSIERNDT